MFEFWIESAGSELYRQPLSEGRFVLGRAEQNDIPISNPNISRKHLRLEVTTDQITITDLGSTNGTQLNGQRLVPHRAEIWPPQEIVRIGDLVLHIELHATEPAAPSDYVEPPTPLSPGGIAAASIVSSNAVPQLTHLTANRPIFAGSHVSCAIRLSGTDVADYHCRIELIGGHVKVTNMDLAHPAILEGRNLPVGEPVVWPANSMLQVGSAMLIMTPESAATAAYGQQALRSMRPSGFAVWLRRSPFLLIALAGVVFVCLFGALFIASNRTGCGLFDFGCIFSGNDDGLPVAGNDGPAGLATPTRRLPVGVPVGPNNETISLTSTPPPAPPVDCSPPEEVLQPGWLELPFPYSGAAEDFRRVSRRSRSGGRINSFFDHEYPVYPPRLVSGLEPVDKGETLVIFDGTISQDAFSQDANGGDYYSGHAGIDFSPEKPREPTTPVLAAAEGRLLLAKIDKDDNHMVWLEHDPDGDGVYQFATLYFHLHPDEFFNAMLTMEERTPIAAGQRIGTMGTTGRSSGIHLHFEVREDINGDRLFSAFEKVDPYGFFPSQEVEEDPWAVAATWIDSHGKEIEHEGIVSNYLWKHRLVEEVVDPTGDCQQEVGVTAELYPVLGYAVVNSGFSYIARNQNGDIVRQGLPHLRSITVRPEHLEGVDVNTLSLEFLDPVLGIPITIREKKQVIPLDSGGVEFSAEINKTGRYVLVAREVADNVPPITSIKLSGDQVSGEFNVFEGSVEITLSARDEGEIKSSIKEIQYSIDCGQNWTVYQGSFTVTLETPHSCGEEGVGSQGVELSENDFILLVMSEDTENNIEQPPAQAQFSIR